MDKKELDKLLEDETDPLENEEKYQKHKASFEFKKLKDDVGIIKGEYYESGILSNRGSLTLPIDENQAGTVWNSMKVGENKFYVITLDSKEKTLPEKLMAFFNRTIEEGTINIPFLSVGNKSN